MGMLITEQMRAEWRAELTNASPLDQQVARIRLAAAAGDISAANAILDTAMASYRQAPTHQSVCNRMVLAALHCGRLDIVAQLLSAINGYGLAVELSVQDRQARQRHAHIFRCEISEALVLKVEIPWTAFEAKPLGFMLSRLVATLPLFGKCLQDGQLKPSEIVLNTGDFGQAPGLVYCCNSAKYTLIPDPDFLRNGGYASMRHHFRQNAVPWSRRRQQALWRGSTTGSPDDPAIGWRSMPRVKLCRIAQDDDSGIFDVGLTRVELLPDNPGQQEIPASGLMRPTVPMENSQQYRYQIDIDGHTSAWSALFQKLLTGSPVLKVQSAQGWRQWYYDRLIPWENYVPIKSDMSDLASTIGWLMRHDAAAQRIGNAGRALADSLTYESELAVGAATVAAAL